MKDIWFTSDTHLGHANILKFTGDDGKLIRPGFSCVEEMDERIIDNWNKVVKPGDHVWHLGDFSFGGKDKIAGYVGRLHGRKRLCVGNHDPVKKIAPFFDKVVLWRIFKEFNFTCTHIPLMPGQMRKTAYNVHGHIHQNLMQEYYTSTLTGNELHKDDRRYVNICVEHTNYTPVHLDEIIARCK